MTIEIKELIIRASVNRSEDSSVNNPEKKTIEENSSHRAIEEQKIVRSCVEQVLEILKREKER
jgi:hypothetical protein